MARIKANIVVMACAIVAVFSISTTSVLAKEITGRASVVDGDTIEIAGTRIRFNGVDAPESTQRCNDAAGKPYRCGRTSALALDAFLAKSRPTTCTATGKSYDRIVATCWRADGQDVGGWLVRNGHAVDWPKYSNGRYAADQHNAESERKGIWSGSFQAPCAVRRAKCD